MTTVENKKTSFTRKADANDIDGIAEIEQKCFHGATAYSKRQLTYLILKANSTSIVESNSYAIRGFIIVLYRKGTQIGYLETLDVDPAFQSQGIGLKLLLAAEEEIKSRGLKFSQLEVSEGNEAAVGLYQKAGYKQKKRLVGFYKFKHHGTYVAVRMIKTLEAVQ